MVKNILQKTSIIFLTINIVVIGMVEARQRSAVVCKGNKNRSFEFNTSVAAISGVLQNIAKAIVNLGPVLSGVGAATDPASALSIFGQVMHVAADLQKQQAESALSAGKIEKNSFSHTRSKRECSCPCVCSRQASEGVRSLHVSVCPMDKIVGLVIKTAQLPSVTKKSSLWCLKKGVVRSCPEALCQEMMSSKKNKNKVLRDFFSALKTQVVEELEKQENVTTRSAWNKAILPVGAALLIPLINFLVDVIQKIMNEYIDKEQADMTAQGGISIGSGQPVELAPAFLSGVNHLVDDAQGLLNQVIDEEQEKLTHESSKESAS